MTDHRGYHTKGKQSGRTYQWGGDGNPTRQTYLNEWNAMNDSKRESWNWMFDKYMEARKKGNA